MRVLNTPGCLVQVRMIAQPIDAAGFELRDAAAHLVYSVGPTTGDASVGVKNAVAATQESMIADLREIKRLSTEIGAPTTGEPLGVHPALSLEGKNGSGKVAGAVKKWIKKYVSVAPELRSVTYIGPSKYATWAFATGDIVGGRWTAAALPSFIDFDKPESAATAPNHMRLHHRDDFSNELMGGADMRLRVVVGKDRIFHSDGSAAPSTAANTANTLRSSIDEGITEAVESDATRRLLFGIDDPVKTHLLNIDCVSCHSNTPLIVMGRIQSTRDRVRVPRGITGYVESDAFESAFTRRTNTRSFGYFEDHPSVSLRTLSETVRVVEMLNRGAQANKPVAERLPGTARDCTAKDDAVFDCFVHSIGCEAGKNREILKTCGELLSE